MIITFIYGLFSDQNVEKGDFSILSKIYFKLTLTYTNKVLILDVLIIDSAKSSFHLKLKEAFHIKTKKPELNVQVQHFKDAVNF